MPKRKLKSGHSTLGMASPVLNKREGFPVLICWQHSYYCSLGSCRPSFCQGHIAGSRSTWRTHRLLCKAISQMDDAQAVLILSQVPVCALSEFHEVAVSPFLWSIEVSPDGSTTQWCTSHCSHFCVTSKLAEATICPMPKISHGDIEQNQTQYFPLVYITSYQTPSRFCSTHHPHMGLSVEPVFNPPHRPPPVYLSTVSL